VKREGFLRNVCVALGHRRNAGAAERLCQTLAEDSDVLVRAYAAWALGEIGAAPAAPSAVRTSIVDALDRAAAHDTSPEVCS